VLRDRLGRDPSDAELSSHIHISPKRIAYIRKARPSLAEGSFQRQGEEGEDIFQPAVHAQAGDHHLAEMLYHDLGPIDQVILETTLGLHNKRMLANQDIARRLGISPGAVSQRKARIQAKLDEFTNINPLGSA
jgi:DNA-directed RNA polymerase specialized sigma subunit